MSQTHLLHFLFCLSFSSPHFWKKNYKNICLFRSPFSLACFLFACVLACLLKSPWMKTPNFVTSRILIIMFFISTPIAPTTSAESNETNAALLNLVKKEQFSSLPSEDAASHLNTFIELCDMQKKVKKLSHDSIFMIYIWLCLYLVFHGRTYLWTLF